ncbi:MAG: hypothetical protein KAS94_05355 [Desulfobulbaceae bacterium]|nr:hypothetical protein [Desulfobulbaceae bacterium]
MSEKTGIEKLRILLPHWIEHNDNHIAEFSKWQQVAAEETGNQIVDEQLNAAVAAMKKSGEALTEVLKELGGAVEGHHHHHHH